MRDTLLSFTGPRTSQSHRSNYWPVILCQSRGGVHAGQQQKPVPGFRSDHSLPRLTEIGDARHCAHAGAGFAVRCARRLRIPLSHAARLSLTGLGHDDFRRSLHAVSTASFVSWLADAYSTSSAYPRATVRRICYATRLRTTKLERRKGLKPLPSVWKTDMLPLNTNDAVVELRTFTALCPPHRAIL